MMLKSYNTAGISITKVYHAEIVQVDLHVLCAQKKTRRWSSLWRQDRTMIHPMKAISVIQTIKAIILNARIVYHLLSGNELFDHKN